MMKNTYRATRRRWLAIALTLGFVPLAAGHASATPITGQIYQNTPDATNAGDPANRGAGLPNAMFTSTAINYSSPPDAYTPNGFLKSPAFTNLLNGFNPIGSLSNTEIVLTGSTFLNTGANSFVVGHDDGVVLTFADPSIGLVVNQPGPTSFVSTPFTVNNTGAAGLYSFTLDYSECCGPPAGLLFQINGVPVGGGGNVPEPASLLLLGTGLVSGVCRWRKSRTNG
jgi:hypothetical protein